MTGRGTSQGAPKVGSAARGGRIRPRAAGLRNAISALLFTVPAWALILLVVALPVIVGVVMSFQNQTLDQINPPRFVGLRNYQSGVLTQTFLESLQTTAVLVIGGLLIQMPIGIGLAVILAKELRGTRLFRSTILMPMLLTPVAVGLMWRFMFNSDLGIFDWGLRQLGLPGINWIGDPAWSVIAIILVDSWQNIPFVMLFCLAGIQGLPKDPYDAARVDGASGFQLLRYVTLPLLEPILLVVLMLRIVEGVKLFDLIYVITAGGPGTATQNLSLLAYRTGFTFLATSRGAAIGVVLALMLAPIYILWTRATRR